MNSDVRSAPTYLHIDGTVEEIDRHGRTVTLATSSCSLKLTVLPSCTVHLRGEPVRLHLLQPRDRVSVCYTTTPGGATAHAIDIDHCGSPPLQRRTPVTEG